MCFQPIFLPYAKSSGECVVALGSARRGVVIRLERVGLLSHDVVEM